MSTKDITADPENVARLQSRIAQFNKRPGPRVGDFVRLPRLHKRHPEFTRITEDHGHILQTGGMSGAYYFFPSGGLSYSGGLDRGVKRDALVPTEETRDGTIWFFDRDQSGPGRGVYGSAPMRVFTVRGGADISGLDELRCPFYVTSLTAQKREQGSGYWFTVTKHGLPHEGFNAAKDLMEWLAANEIALTQPLPALGTFAHISTRYVDQLAA